MRDCRGGMAGERSDAVEGGRGGDIGVGEREIRPGYAGRVGDVAADGPFAGRGAKAKAGEIVRDRDSKGLGNVTCCTIFIGIY